MESAGGVGSEPVFFHHTTPNQMFLNDALQHGRGAGVVPNRFRVHDRNRAVQAHAQAVGFGAVNQWSGAVEFEFFETALEVFPRFKARLAGATFWFGLICAQEDVTPVVFHAQRIHRALQLGQCIAHSKVPFSRYRIETWRAVSKRFLP